MKKRKIILPGVLLLCLFSSVLVSAHENVECALAHDNMLYSSELPAEHVASPSSLVFTDINDSDWFYNSVHYVNAVGMMTGLNKTTFGPYEYLARAQFAVILHRMSHEPEVIYSVRFPDIAPGLWYTDAVLWAADASIVTGYSNGNFGPADLITREQLALMMYRYANSRGYDISDKADLSQYYDASFVSEFAYEAMEWAVGTGLISGKDGQTKLDPQGFTTRAECATILMRFAERDTINELMEMYNNLQGFEGQWSDFGGHINKWQGMVRSAIEATISLSDYFANPDDVHISLWKVEDNDDVLMNGANSTNQHYIILFEGYASDGNIHRTVDCMVDSPDGINLICRNVTY